MPSIHPLAFALLADRPRPDAPAEGLLRGVGRRTLFSLLEFLDFVPFWKVRFGGKSKVQTLVWPIHSGSESWKNWVILKQEDTRTCAAWFLHTSTFSHLQKVAFARGNSHHITLLEEM